MRALEDVEPGTFVIEYVGELISATECQVRLFFLVEKQSIVFVFVSNIYNADDDDDDY